MSSDYPHRSSPSLAQLPTPCLLLERAKLARNLARMASAVAARGVKFRPHLKTAKSAEIAHLAAPGGSPITVSTLREAEYFAYHGWNDIFYAVGLGPGKFARATALLRDGVRLVTMVDHPDTAAAVYAHALQTGVPFHTVIEIDCGDHRGGVPPDSDQLVAIARTLGPCFAGVATHGGFSYTAPHRAALVAAARAEAAAVVYAASVLQGEGFRSEIVSLGSSPTALAGVDLSGITEVRAGVYMFWDAYQAGIGQCSLDDIAMSVLAEVIGRPAARPNEFLIDAGAFALSKDTSTAALSPEKNAGYGWVCDAAGHYLPGLRVAKTWQEHGLVVSDTPLPSDAFPIGSRVRILPNHACPTAAAHDRYFVLGENSAVVAEWPRVNGW